MEKQRSASFSSKTGTTNPLKSRTSFISLLLRRGGNDPKKSAARRTKSSTVDELEAVTIELERMAAALGKAPDPQKILRKNLKSVPAA